MNCSCDEKSNKKKKFSILKGKENLLDLIRGISQEDSDEGHLGEVVKTETLQDETNMVDTDTFEQNTEIEGADISVEQEIEIKRLKHILDKIENLRYNADHPQKIESEST